MNKPKLLLHTCCGPDATIGLEKLNAEFQVDIFWENSNIYPPEEYQKRLEAIKKVNSHHESNLIIEKYDHQKWLDLVLKNKSFSFEPEGGKRCIQCFRYQLSKTADYAKKNNYEFIATTLTASPKKNIELINKIGKEIAEKNGIKYLETSLRKQNGFLRSLELCKKWDIYRQNYCGCEFSINKPIDN